MDRAGSISFSSLAGAATRAVADRRGSSRTLGGDHSGLDGEDHHVLDGAKKPGTRLPETNSSPNENPSFKMVFTRSSMGIFMGELLVSGRVNSGISTTFTSTGERGISEASTIVTQLLLSKIL